MKLEEAQRLKDEILIENALPKRGVRGFRIYAKSITVTVTSATIGQRLPRELQKRAVFYVIQGQTGKRTRAGK